MRSDKYGNDKAQIKEARRSKAVVRDRHRITPLRVIGGFFKLIIILVIMVCIAAAGYAGYIIYQAPEIDTTTLYDNLTESSIIYDDENKKLDTVFEDENRTLVKYDDIPDNLINAFVALEDKTFWEHDGFNFIRILGAIRNKLISGGQVSGVSTITQQLARNIYLKDKRFDHDMNRKIVEAWYTLKIEHNLSKQDILEAYLNTIYLGFGCYGVESASQAYFSKHVTELTLPQCVALAAIPQSPASFQLIAVLDPSDADDVKSNRILKRTSSALYVVNDESKDRRDTCLQFMVDQGYIDQGTCDKAKEKSLKKMLDPNFNISSSKYSYFTDYVIEQVINDLQVTQNISYEDAWDMVYNGGLRIYSTMNKKTQKIIQNEFKDNSNFPSPTNISYDENGNILNKNGKVAMYDYDNYIKNKKFTFKKKEIKKNEDGSLTIMAGKRLKIYTTDVNGQTDYSIEFPTLYKWSDGKLYSYNGGYINVPMGYKSLDSKGNVVIDAKFVESEQGKAFFKQKKNGKYYVSSKNYTINQKQIQPQAAMTIIENKTGHIKAMVGGRKTSGKMLYNRAVQPRQPGSSIKPLAVYSAALQQSYEEAKEGKKHKFTDYKIDKQGTKFWGDYITAGSIVLDQKTTNNGKAWPTNSGGGYSGKNTLRTALRYSLNTCAYKIWKQVGVDYSVKMVKKYGITTLDTKGSVSDLNAAALALGGMTNGVTTLEMANAYTVFPNNGKRAEQPICYTKVTDADGNVLITKEVTKVRVLNSGVAWIMADLMKGVVSGGTGTAAYVSGTQAGGKTGTTSDQYDIWFDGFTPKYAASLWIGNDVNISLTSMSGYAAALWGRIMNQVPGASSGSYKDMPDSVEIHGGEYYAKGTYSTTGYKQAMRTATICKDSGYRATPDCKRTKSKTYDITEGHWPPAYYCPLHNPDPDTYPVSSKVKVVTKPKTTDNKSNQTTNTKKTSTKKKKKSG